MFAFLPFIIVAAIMGGGVGYQKGLEDCPKPNEVVTQAEEPVQDVGPVEIAYASAEAADMAKLLDEPAPKKTIKRRPPKDVKRTAKLKKPKRICTQWKYVREP